MELYECNYQKVKFLKNMEYYAYLVIGKTLPSNKFDFTFVSCGYNIIKQMHENNKIQRKKINFINRLKKAENKIICFCIEVYKNYEGNDFNGIHKLEKIKNKQYPDRNI